MEEGEGIESNSEHNEQVDQPNVAVADLTGKGALQRQGITHRSRGRGLKMAIVNSRSLVQAVTQQQKGSQQAKKSSSRKH